MIKQLFLICLFCSYIFALEFKVGSYNVGNLFDASYDGTEYYDFDVSKNAYWDEHKYKQKLKNISKVLKDAKLDIVVLQEIENSFVLKQLQNNLPMYKYKFFYKRPGSPIGISIFSRYKIVASKLLHLPPNRKKSRDILKSTIKIDGKNFIIFSTHFRSKRAPESHRIAYAIAINNEIKNLQITTDYIIIGDLNSNYDEYKTIKHQKRLNNTSGITGINHILNTIYKDIFVTKSFIQTTKPYFQKLHYNTWLDVKKTSRFSYRYKQTNQTPDNILLSYGVFDNKDISYVDGSFTTFKPKYLYSNGKINKIYSDHLPIYASFDTQKKWKQNTNTNTKNSIRYLYTIDVLEKPVKLDNITVIYKKQKGTIIQDQKGDTIYLYKCSENLKLNHNYNLTINTIKDYYGLTEITKISKIKLLGISKSSLKSRYIDTKIDDIQNKKYQSRIIDNISGVYKKKYLYYRYKNEEQKIRLYFADKTKKPKQNSRTTLKAKRLSIYYGKMQIVID